MEVPTQQFDEWDKLISRFLWEGKKPRIRYKTLQLIKERGGLNLPCLYDYYCAAQLRPLVCWCNPTYSARWIEIERALLQGPPLAAIIADSKLRNKMIDKNNPWINIAMKAWDRTVKLCGLQNHLVF